MRPHGSRTLSLYVAREVAQYTLLGLVAITTVMVARELVQVLEKVVGAGLRLDDLLAVVRIFASMLVVYALPVSFLFGILLAIGRMAADLEIVAMAACGIGMRALAIPIGVLALLISLATVHLTREVEPAAYRAMSLAGKRMLVRGAAVEAGRFNSIGHRTLYVDDRGAGGRLRGVMISDRTDPERPLLVFAETGAMHLDEEAAEWVLSLERGEIHLEPAAAQAKRYQQIRFDALELRMDVSQAIRPEPFHRARALSIGELRATVAALDAGGDPGELRESPEAYRSHLERRYAIPFAPLAFAGVGVPLGVQRKRGARSYGVILCAGLAFGYYALESFCELLVTERQLPPRVLWAPNLVFAALGAALWWRARRAR